MQKKIFIILGLSLMFFNLIMGQSDFNGHWQGYAIIENDGNRNAFVHIELKILLNGKNIVASCYEADDKNNVYSIMDMEGYAIHSDVYLLGKHFIEQRKSENFTNLLADYELHLNGDDKLEGLIHLKYDEATLEDDKNPIKVFLTRKKRMITKSNLFSYEKITHNKNNIDAYYQIDKNLNAKLNKTNGPTLKLKLNEKEPFAKKNIAHKKTIIAKSPISVEPNLPTDTFIANLDMNQDKEEIIRIDLDRSMTINYEKAKWMKNEIKHNQRLQVLQKQIKKANQNEYEYKLSFADTPIYLFVTANTCYGDTMSITLGKKLVLPWVPIERIPNVYQIQFDKKYKQKIGIFMSKVKNANCNISFIFKTFSDNTEYQIFLRPAHHIINYISLYINEPDYE